MSSIPPVLPGGQQKKRNSTIIIAVAAITAMVLGTVFLWPAVPSTGSVPSIFRRTDVQTGENPIVAPLSHAVLSPAVNPELQIQERFRAGQAEAARLYDNPELKTLDYARTAQTQSAQLEALDTSVWRYEFPEYAAP